MTVQQFGGRAGLSKTSVQRKIDAVALYERRRWRGAMYLIGYAVECRLEARLMEIFGVFTLSELEKILTRKRKETVFLKTHSIEYLFGFFAAGKRVGKDDKAAYLLCTRWSTSWRYDPGSASEVECRNLLEAADRFLRLISANS